MKGSDGCCLVTVELDLLNCAASSHGVYGRELHLLNLAEVALHVHSLDYQFILQYIPTSDLAPEHIHITTCHYLELGGSHQNIPHCMTGG